MFEVWGRNRDTKKFEKIEEFWYERNKFYYADKVDRTKYSEIIINSGQDVLYYEEFKDYRSYYEKYGIKQRTRKK